MLRKQLLTSSFVSAKDLSSATESAFIISEFKLENSYYRMVLFAEDSLVNSMPIGGVLIDDINNVLKTLLQSIGIANFSEVERFTVKGKLCIVVETLFSEEPLEKTACNLSSVLTDRELQIATLVASGKVNKQIAKQLHISEWTVATYLRRMFAKLSVDSRAALVYRCAPLIQKSQALSASATEQ